MQTPKEIFLELLKPNGRPERVLKQYEALHMCLNDPINTYLRGNRRRGSVSRDRWGPPISFPAAAPGAIRQRQLFPPTLPGKFMRALVSSPR